MILGSQHGRIKQKDIGNISPRTPFKGSTIVETENNKPLIFSKHTQIFRGSFASLSYNEV